MKASNLDNFQTLMDQSFTILSNKEKDNNYFQIRNQEKLIQQQLMEDISSKFPIFVKSRIPIERKFRIFSILIQNIKESNLKDQIIFQAIENFDPIFFVFLDEKQYQFFHTKFSNDNAKLANLNQNLLSKFDHSLQKNQYKRENQELKDQLKKIKDEVSLSQEEIKILKKENENLQNEVKNYQKTQEDFQNQVNNFQATQERLQNYVYNFQAVQSKINFNQKSQNDQIQNDLQFFKDQNQTMQNDLQTKQNLLKNEIMKEINEINKQSKSRIITYRVFNSQTGWSPWASNGEMAGTMNQKIEAFQFKYDGPGQLLVKPHIENKGWTKDCENQAIVGSISDHLRIEALIFSMKGASVDNFKVEVFVQGRGWMTAKLNQVVGTSGQSRPLFLIKITISN